MHFLTIMYIIYILISMLSGVAAAVPYMHDADWCPALHKPTSDSITDVNTRSQNVWYAHMQAVTEY